MHRDHKPKDFVYVLADLIDEDHQGTLTNHRVIPLERKKLEEIRVFFRMKAVVSDIENEKYG